ncbi:MAG: PEP-CTERM sorting domain-containing protein [Vicinamibacteraceae bacterium]|nr:PEP-CTERM sorting domain-containing protein [Vicinamibacteraceae bacterium]
MASLTTGNATGTVAEPATLVLMGLVLAAAGARLRRPR